MSCPLFVDFTRECVSKYPEFISYQDFDICESENYSKCPMYQIINGEYICKYLDNCSEIFMKNSPELVNKIFSEKKIYNLIKAAIENYCISKLNSKNCKRYQKYENGELPSYRLFPDGKSHIIDIILNREIAIK